MMFLHKYTRPVSSDKIACHLYALPHVKYFINSRIICVSTRYNMREYCERRGWGSHVIMAGGSQLNLKLGRVKELTLSRFYIKDHGINFGKCLLHGEVR